MRTSAGVPPWTPRDQTLLRTAQVMHAYLHGEFDQIQAIPVEFAVAGSFPDDRVVAAAPYRRYSFESRGDGSYAHDGGFFFASGGLGLAITAGAAIGRAVGNSRRRSRAKQLAQAAWHPMDGGAVYVNQYGFHLRSATGLLWWGWEDILECQMVQPGRLALLGVSTAGQRSYLIDSDLAELLFGTWAIVRQPGHSQFRQGIWLIPEWMEHYRAVYGPAAFDFARALPGPGGATP